MRSYLRNLDIHRYSHRRPDAGQYKEGYAGECLWRVGGPKRPRNGKGYIKGYIRRRDEEGEADDGEWLIALVRRRLNCKKGA